MQYELTLLLPDESEINLIKQTVTELKGKISKENNWGKKFLAYPIKKVKEAMYFNWLLEMDQKNINKLKKRLNFNEKIIRHLILKVD